MCLDIFTMYLFCAYWKMSVCNISDFILIIAKSIAITQFHIFCRHSYNVVLPITAHRKDIAM